MSTEEIKKMFRLNVAYNILLKTTVEDLENEVRTLKENLKDLKTESRTDEIIEEQFVGISKKLKNIQRQISGIETSENDREAYEPIIKATIGKTLYFPDEIKKDFGLSFSFSEKAETQKTSQQLREAYIRKYGRTTDNFPDVSDDILSIIKLPASFVLVRDKDERIAPGYYRIKFASYFK